MSRLVRSSDVVAVVSGFTAAAVLSGLLHLLAAPPLPLQDIKHGQRVIAVSDPNRGTLTLVPGAGEVWICVPYGLAQKSCKKAQDVVGWILQNGQSLSGIEPSEYVAFHAGDGHE